MPSGHSQVRGPNTVPKDAPETRDCVSQFNRERIARIVKDAPVSEEHHRKERRARIQALSITLSNNRR